MTKLTYPGPHPAVSVPGLGVVAAGQPVDVDDSDLAARLREQGWTDGTADPPRPPADPPTDAPDPDVAGKPTRSRASRGD